MILSALTILLTLVGGSNGQYDGCDYFQQMDPGKTYYASNREYPQFYKPGVSCRWISASDRPIKLTCNPFNIPVGEKCNQDALIVQQSDESIGHRYCGNGNFTVLSKTNKLTIILTASPNTQGGRFLCTLTTESANDDDSNCKCGWENPVSLVEGVDTSINEYPMMVAVIDVENRVLMCGGTIINEKQVLTAAHCVIGRSATNTAVVIGEHDFKKGSETNATKLYFIDSYQAHPNYNAKLSDHDIAIVTIRGTIIFNERVGPVCLPFQHSPDTFAGNHVDILGWGSSQFGNGPVNTLQEARVTVITNSRCKRDYPDVTTRQICTLEDGIDSCQFDSGGPLLWRNPSTRRIVEVGIISLGSACANGKAAQNTRVGAFVDWIVSNTPQGIKYCKIE